MLSIAVNVVLAVFIGIVLAVFLFVVRMSRSNIRKLYRCDNVRSRRYRDPSELEVLHAQGASVLVVELQGALFFGSAERLAQIVERETAQGTKALLLEMRRITEIDSTGARPRAASSSRWSCPREPRPPPVSPTSSTLPTASFRISTARSSGPKTTCSG